MMKDELRNLDIAELGELSKAAKLDETKMIDLWKDKVGAKIENPLPAPITRVNTQKLSAWGARHQTDREAAQVGARLGRVPDDERRVGRPALAVGVGGRAQQLGVARADRSACWG